LAREGIGFIIQTMLFCGVLSLGAVITDDLGLKIVALTFWVVFLFVLYFFRDPRRNPPQGENLIVSAADGRITDIREVYEKEYLQSKVILISIFMSIFDVHINRIPMTGRIAYFQYKRGKFRPAFKAEASSENEQTVIGIEGDRCKILLKQIAGVMARRIVCDVREGDQVRVGQKFGMIKLGSRIDMFLPLSVEIKVKPKDRVKAGESIIGEIKDEK